MNSMVRPCLIVVVGLLFPLLVSAQRIRNVTGEYYYYPPETQSLEVARQVAVERAKIQILADTFGTVMQSTSSLRIEQSSGSSSVGTTTLSASEVRGEWIETTEGPEIETVLSPEGMLGLHVRLRGRVREITSARTQIQAQVLCNGTEPRFASLEFKDGDDLFLRFKSPVDGYLLVYLYDGDEDVFCLLPYRQQPMSIFPVEAMQEYLLFSGEGADTYFLTCSRGLEINHLYILFSPNKFSRAADTAGGSVDIAGADGLPRTLSWQAFQHYLSRTRAADPEMIVEDYMLTINKN